ncbi:MAG: L,D-transpeptidase family protein [Stellaceae bacterium]
MPRSILAPLLLVTLLLAAGAPSIVPPAAAQEASDAALKSLLAADGGLRLAGRSLDRPALAQLYDTRDYQPIWASERDAALVKALGGAAAHGLDPAAFAVPAASPDERELLLTDAFLRYATALAQGRVRSAAIESDWALPAPDFDAEAALEQAATGDPEAVLAGLSPTEPAYQRLQAALIRYRAIAAAGGWPHVPEAGKLMRGDSGAAVARLRRRLVAEGLLPADATGTEFDAALEDAVKHFQANHGIAVDGRVGHDTYEALNVPAAARVEQIRDNLERWREMPRDWPATRIEVNVPAAWLTVIEHGVPGLSMRAIVGAEAHPTPVLRARMNAVLFNPPWNIPASIVRKEILPHVRHDPHYLDRNHYVYIGARGRSPLQQLPGPDNALGRIKFELPNIYDVYLHDTPTHPLFTRVIRTLSHGCVRLEDPRDLALYVLAGGKTSWSLDEIDGAIAQGDTRRVPLAHSLPVYLLYWTAFVDPDGAVEFRDDIYGRDLRLAAAMDARDAEERLAAAALLPPAPGPLATKSIAN